MKTFLSFLFFLSFTVFQSQLKKVEVVDFYNWTSNDGVHYQFIMAGEEPTGLNVEQPPRCRANPFAWPTIRSHHNISRILYFYVKDDSK